MADDQRPTILIIDDDPIMLNLVVRMLSRDYRVRPFTSGHMAFKFLALPSASVNLVLLDQQMPGFDGREVLHRLKQDSKTASLPVIFLTGLEGEEAQSELCQLGALDCISKPPLAKHLLDKIQQYISLP